MMRVLGILGIVIAFWFVAQLVQENYTAGMGSRSGAAEDGSGPRSVGARAGDKVDAAMRESEARLARQLGE